MARDLRGWTLAEDKCQQRVEEVRFLRQEGSGIDGWRAGMLDVMFLDVTWGCLLFQNVQGT